MTGFDTLKNYVRGDGGCLHCAADAGEACRTDCKRPREYRDFTIHFDPPPIPDRRFDWHFTHKDYDGPEDPRCGSAATVQACRSEIDEMLNQ